MSSVGRSDTVLFTRSIVAPALLSPVVGTVVAADGSRNAVMRVLAKRPIIVVLNCIVGA